MKNIDNILLGIDKYKTRKSVKELQEKLDQVRAKHDRMYGYLADANKKITELRNFRTMRLIEDDIRKEYFDRKNFKTIKVLNLNFSDYYAGQLQQSSKRDTIDKFVAHQGIREVTIYVPSNRWDGFLGFIKKVFKKWKY